MMKIDFNETECLAMQAYADNDPEEGSRLQGKFLEELKQSMKAGKDYCPCQTSCDIHGKCMLCVQIHRGHGNHLPACLQLMLNKKLALISELSEHTIIDCVKKPEYLK